MYTSKIKSKISGILFSVFVFFLPLFLQAATLQNPLGVKNVQGLFANIVKFLLGFVGMVSLVYFIIGGFYWMTSGGSQERVKKGRDTLVWAVLGLVASLGSYLLLSQIITAIDG